MIMKENTPIFFTCFVISFLKLSSVRKFIGIINQAFRAGNNFVSIRNRSGVRSHFKRLACGISRVGYVT